MNITNIPSPPPLPRQTTVLFGGSNGTKTIISTLGDKSNPDNINHTLRIVTRNPSVFFKSTDNKSSTSTSQELITWRCHEQKHFSNIFPAAFIPSSWITHVGKPDSIFGYSDAELEAAISGIFSPPNDLSSSNNHHQDDGGVADVIILACPVSAHLSILRHIARILYKLDMQHKILSSSAPPLLIGTLYSAGGFDWMCRLAFCMEKPPGFLKWNRTLGLFGLRSFPYLCKSLKKGEVSLFGRFPQLGVVVSPSTETMRKEVARRVMGRVLKGEENGIRMAFMGLDERSVNDEYPYSTMNIYNNVNSMAKGAAAATVVAQIGKGQKVVDEKGKNVVGAAAAAATTGLPTPSPASSTIQDDGNLEEFENNTSTSASAASAFQHIRSMTDHADPYSALGFFSCTLNSTNQILHSSILYALFNTPTGEISWPENEHITPFPRFYADGANKVAGATITSIALAEFYPLMAIFEAIFAPTGMHPITSQHGGEPLGRFGLTKSKNHPIDIAERSGLFDKVMYGKSSSTTTNQQSNKGDIVNYRYLCSWFMHKGLSNNSRLGYVLAPAIRDKVNKDMIKPIVTSRFFVDDIPHGLCVSLGLGEMLGLNLEKDMEVTLHVVRRLQTFMGKEYVQPAGCTGTSSSTGGSCRGKGIVGGARDLNETSAPQAFGVWTVEDLKRFMSISPFGDETGKMVDLSVKGSVLMKQRVASSKL